MFEGSWSGLVNCGWSRLRDEWGIDGEVAREEAEVDRREGDWMRRCYD